MLVKGTRSDSDKRVSWWKYMGAYGPQTSSQLEFQSPVDGPERLWVVGDVHEVNDLRSAIWNFVHFTYISCRAEFISGNIKLHFLEFLNADIDKDPFVLWHWILWPPMADARSRGINSYGIDIVPTDYSALKKKEKNKKQKTM